MKRWLTHLGPYSFPVLSVFTKLTQVHLWTPTVHWFLPSSFTPSSLTLQPPTLHSSNLIWSSLDHHTSCQDWFWYRWNRTIFRQDKILEKALMWAFHQAEDTQREVQQVWRALWVRRYIALTCTQHLKRCTIHIHICILTAGRTLLELVFKLSEVTLKMLWTLELICIMPAMKSEVRTLSQMTAITTHKSCYARSISRVILWLVYHLPDCYIQCVGRGCVIIGKMPNIKWMKKQVVTERGYQK